VSHIFDVVTVRGNYSYSSEHDYLSHTIGGSLEKELFDKTWKLPDVQEVN